MTYQRMTPKPHYSKEPSKPKTFTTPKGTSLDILDLRGKQYLEVKYRLVWFREDKPNWSIETEMIGVTDVSAYAKATIRDETGRVIATSHKFENKQGFPDFIEKAETGAIGRALALCGFGTQFCADELDEGKRIVDSPVTSNPPEIDREEMIPEDASFGSYVVPIGKKFKGIRLDEIQPSEIQSFVKWLKDDSSKTGKPITGKTREFVEAAEAYLAGVQQ